MAETADHDSLYAELLRLYETGDDTDTELLGTARRSWPAASSVPATGALAESCRLAMLVSRRLGNKSEGSDGADLLAESNVWKARSLAAAARAGALNVIAALMIPESFHLLSESRFAEAREVLGEMAPPHQRAQ